ncbi:HAMP domain-containing sensor histidine kinase [Methanoregula sp.]|uniref:sensor histidine kinase n=1 Tax=Methanoregula sp. TaxID=2052170 RepID=UPI002C8F3688|nr:HAMP domain-containing sensor histidine kinase [Methanoregula sp.]HVP95731.1 HAMP domain-containing sensor histidine kinase [Methanoregula sp.]
MWTPDIRTLFLLLFLVNVFLTLLLFSFWKSQKTYDGFRTWMLSLLVASCGYFLFILGVSLPVFLSTTVANLLFVLSVMMRLDSTGRYFRSKALPGILYCILVPAALILCWFTFRIDSVVVRGVIIGVLIVPCFMATSLLALRFREPETRSLRYGFAAALLVMALLWTVVIVVAILTPGDHSLSGPDPLNPVFFIVTILMDIVATVFFLLLNMARTQTELRESEAALFRANRKLTILSSITRHDIKNQLIALSEYLELSKENRGKIPEYLEKEMGIAETIGLQIDFSKAYEDMGTTAPVWQNVNECIRRAAAALPMREVRLDVDRSDPAIYADPLFEKVFYNLIENALRHGGDAMTRISISSHETGKGLVLICEDDGVGIIREDKTHLFEQGFGKHTGLGLFLSREILSITGITITENGEPGKGARFEMNVPKGEYRFGPA